MCITVVIPTEMLLNDTPDTSTFDDMEGLIFTIRFWLPYLFRKRLTRRSGNGEQVFLYCRKATADDGDSVGIPDIYHLVYACNGLILV